MMKKNITKFAATVAALAMTCAVVPTISSSAVFIASSGPITVSDSYTQVDINEKNLRAAYDSFIYPNTQYYEYELYQNTDLSYTDPETGDVVPVSGTNLCEITHNLYNSISLTIPADNYDAYAEIWNNYEDKIAYTYYSDGWHYSNGDICVTIRDDTSATSSTKDVIADFIDELQSADIVTEATYGEHDYYQEYKGSVGTGMVISVGDDDTDLTDEIYEVAMTYLDDEDSTFSVERHESDFSYTDLNIGEFTYANTHECTSYYIVPDDSTDITYLAKVYTALSETYPEGVIETRILWQESVTTLATELNNTIDLLAIEDWSEFVTTVAEDDVEPIPDDVTVEEPTIDTLCGDIDADGSITPFDARLALVAYASEQVGQDTGLTDDQMALADVDGDGVVTAVDAHYILVYYATEQVSTFVTWDAILNAK